MVTPGWYAVLLIGLGVYRICRLVGWDDITAKHRARLIGISDEAHSQWTWALNAIISVDGDPWSYQHPTLFMEKIIEGLGTEHATLPPLVWKRFLAPGTGTKRDVMPEGVVPFGARRWYWSKLLRCPWCLGWWVALLVWIAYQAEPGGTLVVMSLFAVSSLPGLITKNLDK